MRAVLAAVAGVMVWQLTALDGLRAQVQSNAREAAEGSRPAVSKSAGEHAVWPRLFVSDPIERSYLRRALEHATVLLSESQCQTMLDEFRDRHGRPVAERLARLGVSAPDYLRWIVFVDAGDSSRCGDGTLAFTNPGSRVVHVCAREFELSFRHNPDHAEASLIHEALHTLGLGENPPASADITHRVRMLCRKEHD